MNRNEIEFLKIDWIIYENFQFTDVSIIYNLNKTEQSNDEIIKLIKKDMTEFYNDGMIYKSLKRCFSIFNLLKTIYIFFCFVHLFGTFGHLFHSYAFLFTGLFVC